MSDERMEVTLGVQGGTKVFASFKELEDWLGTERRYWDLFQNARSLDRENQKIWSLFENAFNQINYALSEMRNARSRAEQAKKDFEPERHTREVQAVFKQHFETGRLIASNTPKAKFLAELAASQGPTVALFACGYFMRVQLDYGNLERLRGALAATHYEEGFTNPIQHEKRALEELRSGWEKTFQQYRETLYAESEKHKKVNEDAATFLATQEKLFAELVAKEQKDWTTLHKTYDESLALAKPVQYWANKARAHRCLAWGFGSLSLLVAGGVFFLLFKLIETTLRMPAGIQDPSKWHPQYWQVAVLLAAGVFSVWIVRIFVQLFLSNVHLLTDANERVTMARTYLALMRRDGGFKPEDRQLILQTLFRPAATGVVKDDGIPLSALEAVTKLGQR